VSGNISRLTARKGLSDNLFERLVSLEDQHSIASTADEFLVGESTIYGSTTFYELLQEENRGKRAFVCNGSACLCAGTTDEVQQQLEAHLSTDEIGYITCLGRCHEAAAFQVDGVNYSGNSAKRIPELVNREVDKEHDKSKEFKDNYDVVALGGKDVLTGEYSLEKFGQDLELMLLKKPQEVLEEIKDSRLRGRGGAGFPLGIKWETCRDTPLSGRNARRYIVCNADEGDPGAYSDRYLLEQQCLKVIFGMVAAAYCIDSQQGVIYIRAEYPESIRNTLGTIEKLLGKSWLGENIRGSDFSFSLKVIRGAGAYICGEETSLLASIEGRRPEVEVRPPFPAVQGLYQQPTVVNNVESFAAIPAIMQMGGTEFASSGTAGSTGTKLLSMDSHFTKPGIYEVQMGFPLKKLIDAAGGFRVPVKALHIGGPLGGLVPMSSIGSLTIDFESFSNAGFLLGHAGVISIPEDFPMIDYLAHLFEFTANESCGKCFPCRLGSVRGHEMLVAAREDNQEISRVLLEDLLETMELGSLCALGGGLPLPIRNALAYFEDELEEYFTKEGEVPAREPRLR